jgi:hypothetical protein
VDTGFKFRGTLSKSLTSLGLILTLVLAVPAFGLIVKTLNSKSVPNVQNEIASSQENSTESETTTSRMPEHETVTSETQSLHPKAISSLVESDTALLEPLQKISIILPKDVPADPRAHTVYLPNVILEGDGFASVCIYAQIGKLDVSKKQSSDTYVPDRKVSLIGDGSSRVILTGIVADIQKVLNSFRGISYFNDSLPVPNSSLQFLVTPQRKPVIDENSCIPLEGQSWKSVEIRPLGLTLGIVKSEIPLHAPN